MYILLLLASIVTASPDKMVIVLDDTQHSQVLKFDLEYDFNQLPPNILDSERYRYYAYIQEEIKKNSVIVDFREVSKLAKLRMSGISKFPAIRLTNYAEVLFFPEDFVCERTYCLLTVKHFLDDYYLAQEIDEWKRKCLLIKDADDAAYCNDIIHYMLDNNFIQDVQSFFPYYGDIPSADIENEKAITKAVAKYGDKKGFPVRKAVIYPPEPVKLFPYQEGYRYTEFPELKIGKKPSYIRN